MIWLQICPTPILNVTVWSCYHCYHAFWLPLTVANRLKIVWLMEECQPVAHKCYHKKYPHYVCPHLFMMNMFRHCRKPLVTLGHKFRNNRWCDPSFLNLSFRRLSNSQRIFMYLYVYQSRKDAAWEKHTRYVYDLLLTPTKPETTDWNLREILPKRNNMPVKTVLRNSNLQINGIQFLHTHTHTPKKKKHHQKGTWPSFIFKTALRNGSKVQIFFKSVSHSIPRGVVLAYLRLTHWCGKFSHRSKGV